MVKWILILLLSPLCISTSDKNVSQINYFDYLPDEIICLIADELQSKGKKAIIKNTKMNTISFLLTCKKFYECGTFSILKCISHSFKVSNFEAAIIMDFSVFVQKMITEDITLINSTNFRYNRTPLAITCIHASLRTAQLLLDHGANTDARDINKRTPLHYTAEYDSLSVARLLIDKKVIIDAKDESGDTPLHYAVTYARYAIAELLLQNGADISLKNGSGKSLTVLAQENSDDKMQVLLQKFSKNE